MLWGGMGVGSWEAGAWGHLGAQCRRSFDARPNRERGWSGLPPCPPASQLHCDVMSVVPPPPRVHPAVLSLLFAVPYVCVPTVVILVTKMGGRVSNYLPKSTFGFVIGGAGDHLLSFLLFWTLGYASHAPHALHASPWRRTSSLVCAQCSTQMCAAVALLFGCTLVMVPGTHWCTFTRGTRGPRQGSAPTPHPLLGQAYFLRRPDVPFQCNLPMFSVENAQPGIVCMSPHGLLEDLCTVVVLPRCHT
jgi:hypothetical protein